MAGLVPAIHVFDVAVFQSVDARHKAGHDGFGHFRQNANRSKNKNAGAGLSPAPALL
jgi:hypothetical protein